MSLSISNSQFAKDGIHVTYSDNSTQNLTFADKKLTIDKGLCITSGGANVTGDIVTSGKLTAATFEVSGATTFSGTSNLSTLAVTGTSTVGGTLGVTGAATLSNTLAVTGAATLSNTLAVTGAATLSGTLGVTEATTLSNTLAVTGSTTLSGSTTVNNTLSVSEATTLSKTLGVIGAATLGNTLAVTGATTLSSTLGVTGTTTLGGATMVNSTLGVTEAVTLSKTLAVTGASTLSNTLAVSGAATLSNTLAVSGAATLSNTLAVSGAATLSNTLAVSGAATLSNTLAVSGAATLSNTLAVNGVASFNKDVFIDGNLAVTDPAILIANGNTADTVSSGIQVQYKPDGASGVKYAGMKRVPGTGEFVFFKDSDTMIDGRALVSSSISGAWVEWNFPDATPIKTYSQAQNYHYPTCVYIKSWTMIGSNDKNVWYKLDSRTDYVPSRGQYFSEGSTANVSSQDFFTVANPVGYSYIRFIIQKISGPLGGGDGTSLALSEMIYRNESNGYISANFIGVHNGLRSVFMAGLTTVSSVTTDVYPIHNIFGFHPPNLASPSPDMSNWSGNDRAYSGTIVTSVVESSAPLSSNDVYASLKTGAIKSNGALDVTGAATVSGNMTISGNLTVLGSQTVIDTTSLQVKDSAILIADGNSADSLAIGMEFQYKPDGASSVKYAGLKRRPGTGEFVLFKDNISHIENQNNDDNYAMLLADSFNCASDMNLKKNVVTIEKALDKLDGMRGVYHDWNDENNKEHAIGVIAQEVQAVYPELVHEGSDGYLSVNYPKLTAVLLQAIKELKALVLSK